MVWNQEFSMLRLTFFQPIAGLVRDSTFSTFSKFCL